MFDDHFTVIVYGLSQDVEQAEDFLCDKLLSAGAISAEKYNRFCVIISFNKDETPLLEPGGAFDEAINKIKRAYPLVSIEMVASDEYPFPRTCLFEGLCENRDADIDEFIEKAKKEPSSVNPEDLFSARPYISAEEMTDIFKKAAKRGEFSVLESIKDCVTQGPPPGFERVQPIGFYGMAAEAIAEACARGDVDCAERLMGLGGASNFSVQEARLYLHIGRQSEGVSFDTVCKLADKGLFGRRQDSESRKAIVGAALLYGSEDYVKKVLERNLVSKNAVRSIKREQCIK